MTPLHFARRDETSGNQLLSLSRSLHFVAPSVTVQVYCATSLPFSLLHFSVHLPHPFPFYPPLLVSPYVRLSLLIALSRFLSLCCPILQRSSITMSLPVFVWSVACPGDLGSIRVEDASNMVARYESLGLQRRISVPCVEISVHLKEPSGEPK